MISYNANPCPWTYAPNINVVRVTATDNDNYVGFVDYFSEGNTSYYLGVYLEPQFREESILRSFLEYIANEHFKTDFCFINIYAPSVFSIMEDIATQHTDKTFILDGSVGEKVIWATD